MVEKLPVHIWFRPTDGLTELDVLQALPSLSDEEQARARRFVRDLDRRDFVAAHALLRSALSHQAGRDRSSWRFETDDLGKPHLAPGQGSLAFSITHTRGLVACAVADGGMVGVDVENLDRDVDIDALIGDCLSVRERDAWLKLPVPERSTRFFETWTLKEAYVKATGEGLSRPLTEFDLHTTERGLVADLPAQSPTPAGKWTFAVYAPTRRTRLSVAARVAGDLQFEARQWPPDRKPVALHPLFQSAGL